MKRERARDRNFFFLKGKKKSKRKRKKNEGMSENRREIMCATRRYHHGRDFGELFSFFFFPNNKKKENQTTSSGFLCYIYFLSTFLLKGKISRCYGASRVLIWILMETPFFFYISSLVPGLSAGWSSLLLDLRIWNDPSIHLSISAPAEKPN